MRPHHLCVRIEANLPALEAVAGDESRNFDVVFGVLTVAQILALFGLGINLWAIGPILAASKF